jgi:hypothetical protein
MNSFARRMALTWVVLTIITLVSWQVGLDHGQPLALNTGITAAVLGFALIKVRFIIREFMEVRTAPASIKWITDIWLVATYAVLLTAYLLPQQ